MKTNFNKEAAFEAWLKMSNDIGKLSPFKQAEVYPAAITEFFETIYTEGFNNAMKERQIKLIQKN